jgi:RNA polymerase sigma factor (sigma-70 family)
MPRHLAITQEKFDGLLAWLDPDREPAGDKYEDLRRSLIKIFTWRECDDAEGLADETLNRVANRVQELRQTYEGDPALYFYGVANNLIKEYQRQVKLQVPLEEIKVVAVSATEEKEENLDHEYECLLRCLRRLDADNRQLILDYYLKEKQEKIDYRKSMARRLGITMNTLRVRSYRIRAALEDCIAGCLESSPSDEMD